MYWCVFFFVILRKTADSESADINVYLDNKKDKLNVDQ